MMKLLQGFQRCNEMTLSAHPLVTKTRPITLRLFYFLVDNNQQESVGKFSATEGECSGGGSGTLQVWGAIGHVYVCVCLCVCVFHPRQ